MGLIITLFIMLSEIEIFVLVVMSFVKTISGFYSSGYKQNAVFFFLNDMLKYSGFPTNFWHNMNLR